MQCSLKHILYIVILTATFVSSSAKEALLVGISNYPANSGWPSIHGANDVSDLKQTLCRQGFNCTSILNQRATATNIRKCLKKFINTLHSGELAYLHFSCHGQPFEDLSGDEDDGWDESIVAYDALREFSKKYKGANHIVDDELEEWLNRIRRKLGPKGYLYVVIDACHIGGASRGEQEDSIIVRGTNIGFSPNNKIYAPKIDKRGSIKISTDKTMSGICIVEACRSYETNVEISNGGNFYGALSYYVNDYLKDHKLTTDRKWVDIIRQRMRKDKRLYRQNIVCEYSE